MDVVVPFRGRPAELEGLRGRLAELRLQPGDTVVVVDNTPRREAAGCDSGPVPVFHASDLATPGYARNRGAERGRAEWVVFLDADVSPPADLLDRYFEPMPDERVGLVAGEVLDEPVPVNGRPAARYAYIRKLLSHDSTWHGGDPRFGFPATANVAVRRSAFEAIGGFRENIRAGEDGDLTYRFREAGWEVRRSERAAAVHHSRQTVRGFIVQKACHGGGAAWLDRHYPGAYPPRRRPGLVWWGVRHAAKGLVRAARRRDRDAALWAVFDPLEQITFEFGRSLPNERPLRPGRRRA